MSLFVLTQLTNVTDRQTDTHSQRDRQTPHDGIGGAYASHGAVKTRMVWLTSAIDDT